MKNKEKHKKYFPPPLFSLGDWGSGALPMIHYYAPLFLRHRKKNRHFRKYELRSARGVGTTTAKKAKKSPFSVIGNVEHPRFPRKNIFFEKSFFMAT
jgi:hypothetical protein